MIYLKLLIQCLGEMKALIQEGLMPFLLNFFFILYLRKGMLIIPFLS